MIFVRFHSSAPAPENNFPNFFSIYFFKKVSRFHSIDQVVGQVYRICKDQHGCRFLQKKLEEKDKNPRSVEIIFNEVYDHMVELMTGLLSSIVSFTPTITNARFQIHLATIYAKN